MMFPCVFAASQTARAFFFQRWVSLGHFPGRVFFVFGVLDQFFGVRGARFARFLHRGSARARICASWRRQTTNSETEGVSKSIFVPPQGSLFGPLFVTFRNFEELCDFVKIELPCGRGLDFESPSRSKCHFFSLGTLSKNWRDPGGSCHWGGGTLLEILSGLRGPPFVAKMLIGTATGYDTKRQLLADVWEQDSEL